MNVPEAILAEALAKANEEIILLRQQLKEALDIIDAIHSAIADSVRDGAIPDPDAD